MHSPNKKVCVLKADCPKYLLLDRTVFYEIKVKQIGPGEHKETFSFFKRYSKLLSKHQSLKKDIPKKSPIYRNFPDFPPKNYCKRLHLSLIVKRQAAFKRYFQTIIDIFKLKTVCEFQKTVSVLFNHGFVKEILTPSNGFTLPYDPLRDYAVQIRVETYPEIALVEIHESNPDFLFEENKGIEDVKSILLTVDSKNQKILKYSQNLTFILFLDERLGKGAYGEVYKGCTNMNEKEVYAIKEITIPSKLNDNYKLIVSTARNEINILKTLNHENIVKYIESFENSNNIYLVMEYCNDGNLEHYIKNNDLAEKDTIELFKQIINGFKYLHKKQLSHRDVKPSNFLLDNMKIKISDFGFARVILKEAWTESHIGTYPYMAPQILQGRPYNNMSDVWSLGITLFFMLFKKIPWVSENPFQLEREIREKLKNNRLFETVQEKKRISKHAEDLLLRMIVYDENLRITWDRLFDHPLLQEQAVFGVESALKASIIENKKAILTKSEFLKKKKGHLNITSEVDCMRYYCVSGGNELITAEDNCQQKKDIDFRKNSNLSHYSMINEHPFFKEENNTETENIVNRKKGKSTNSCLLREQIEQEKTKQESIEDLKNFQSQFSFLMKKPSLFSAELKNKGNPDVEFPSINHESENNSKNVSICRDKPSNSEFFQPFNNIPEKLHEKEEQIEVRIEGFDENNLTREKPSNSDFFQPFGNIVLEKVTEKEEIGETFQDKTAKFNNLIETEQEEEKNPFLQYSTIERKNIVNNINDDNRHSFKPIILQKNDSSRSEEEKETKVLLKPKKDVTFSGPHLEIKPSRDTFARDTLGESHNTAYFKERLTTQNSFEKSNVFFGNSTKLYNQDEIKEAGNENSDNRPSLSALEQKSYQETMLKFKRQDHFRKSCSIANKKLHRRITYERNVLLFICNVAERLQEQQESFDFEPQNLEFFLFLLSKLSLLHLQCLRDEENLLQNFNIDDKEWSIYVKSKLYNDLRKNYDNDLSICNKFFQKKKKELVEMIIEDYKEWRTIVPGGVETMVDLLSQNQQNLPAFCETFHRTLKKVLKEMEVGLQRDNEFEEVEIEKLALTEDLMILFKIKKYFKWEDGKELNLNKFVEDRQYMQVSRLRKRVLEGLKAMFSGKLN